MSLIHILLLLLPLALSVLLTRLVRQLAPRLGLVDKPDGNRKLHGQEIPVGGGVAVWLATIGAIVAAYFMSTIWRDYLSSEAGQLIGLLVASLLIVITGVCDDVVGLRGRHKLAGQLIAAGVLILFGLRIDVIEVFGIRFELHWMAIPFTLFWLVGAINALNLLDGIDGLATSVGIIISCAVAIMAMLSGNPVVVIIASVFAASLFGFLLYNFPPASIYLGDTGSMLIGLVLGSLAIQGSLKGAGTSLLAAPLAVWAIPIFDSAGAIMRRKLTGRSIYASDRAHFHHRLLELFGGHLPVVATISCCCAFTALGALAAVYLKNDVIALLSVVTVLAVLITTRVFGHVELLLLAARFKSVRMSFVKSSSQNVLQGNQTTVRIQGTRPWELLWESLMEFGAKYQLERIELDVNFPSQHEQFHANWQAPKNLDPEILWRTEVPLFVGTSVIGRLTVTGEHNGLTSTAAIGQLMELLEPLDAMLSQVVQDEVPVGVVSETPLALKSDVGKEVASRPRLKAN